jgi:hypothetical protein
MSARRLGESLLIWIVASLIFVAAIWAAFSIISTFAPSGDAAFGFILGLTPSLVAAAIGYIGVSFWALFSSYTKTETCAQKLRFYVWRFLLIEGLLGGIIVLNAIVVDRMF